MRRTRNQSNALKLFDYLDHNQFGLFLSAAQKAQQNYINLHKLERNGENLLHAAIKNGRRRKFVNKLSELGFDFLEENESRNFINENGVIGDEVTSESALDIAVRTRQWSCCADFLILGVNQDLQRGTKNISQNIIDTLGKNIGKVINKKNMYGVSAIDCMAMYPDLTKEHHGLYKLLSDNGARVSQDIIDISPNGFTSLTKMSIQDNKENKDWRLRYIAQKETSLSANMSR